MKRATTAKLAENSECLDLPKSSAESTCTAIEAYLNGDNNSDRSEVEIDTEFIDQVCKEVDPDDTETEQEDEPSELTKDIMARQPFQSKDRESL